MKKNFSANLVFLIALNLLIKPIYVFGIEVGIQNAVGTSDYGLYYAMFNFTFLFNVFLDMGINNFQKIKVAEHAESGIANMSTLIPLKLILAGVYMIVTVIAAWIIGFEGRYWYFIAWIMLNHVLSAFLLLLRANLSGLQLFLKDSVVSVVDRLVLVAGIGCILWFGNQSFQIEWFVIFQAASYVIGIAVALFFTPKANRFPKIDFSLKNGQAMIIQTWPYALLILLMTAYNKLDGIMIERLAVDGLKEAGIYAQAYRIIDAGNSFAFLYAGMLLPIFAKLLSQSNRDQIGLLVDQGARYLIYPAGLAVVVVYFNSEACMSILYDQEAAASAISFRWLMGSFLFICVGYVFGTLLTAANKLGLLNWISAGAVLVNFILNLMLIPSMGAEGAAIASFSSLLVMALTQLFFASSVTNKSHLDWLIRALPGWFIMIVVTYFISNTDLGEMNKLLVSCALALALLMSLAWKKSDMKTLLPSNT